ncbi:MAG: hypothetical protein WA294_05730 [Acidobacteriaceae bacterium]
MNRKPVGSAAASPADPHQDAHPVLHCILEAAWHIESARVIAGLTRLTRDAGLAEDPAQEAPVADEGGIRKPALLMRSARSLTQQEPERPFLQERIRQLQ